MSAAVRAIGLSALLVVSVVAFVAPASAVSDSSAAQTTATTEIDDCTVIDSPGRYVITSNISDSGTCIEITSSDVVLDGQGHALETDNESARNIGIYANGTDGRLSNITVTGVVLNNWVWNAFGSQGRAIRFDDVDDATISNNTLDVADRGIELRNTTESTVTENQLISTGTSRGGLFLTENSDNNTISDNNMTEPGTASDYAGITVDNSDNNTIRDNDIYGSGISLVSGSGYNTLSENVVRPDWQSNGLYAGFSSNNTMVDNEVLGAGSTGIRLNHAGDGNLVADNYVNGTGATGIGLTRVDDSVVRDNVVSGNEGDSINVDIAENVTVRNNTIGDATGDLSNNGWGIQFEDARNGTVRNNTIYLAGGGGIILSDTIAGDSATEDTEVVNNSVNYLTRSQYATYSGNYDEDGIVEDDGILISSGTDGIRLANADDNLLRGNTIRNGRRGIELRNGADNNTLVDNRVYELNDYAVWALNISDSANTTVERLDIGNSTAPNTTVSLTGENVTINTNDTAVSNPDAVPIDRYVEVTNHSTGAVVDIALHYEYDDVADISQSSFALWRFDGTEWHELNDSTLDSENETVSVELDESTLDSSETYGAFGEEGTWPTPTPEPTPESTQTPVDGGGTETGTAPSSAPSEEPETTTTGGSGPGFGAGLAVVAVALAALLVGRRR